MHVEANSHETLNLLLSIRQPDQWVGAYKRQDLSFVRDNCRAIRQAMQDSDARISLENRVDPVTRSNSVMCTVADAPKRSSPKAKEKQPLVVSYKVPDALL